MKFEKIGTKRNEMCYDGKMHTTTLTDYLIRVSGNTYPIKNDLYNDGCMFDGDGKYWFINIESENEINNFVKKYRGCDGVTISLKPIFRITDKL